MDTTALQSFLSRCSHDELSAFRRQIDDTRSLAASVDVSDLEIFVARINVLSAAFRYELTRRMGRR